MAVTSPNLNPVLLQVDLSTKTNKVNFAKQINPLDYNNVKLSLLPPKLTKKPGFLNTKFGQALAGLFSTALTTNISEKLFGKDNDSELGRSLGTLFSTGLDSAGNSLMNNVVKGEMLTKGLAENTGASLAGAGVGLAANYLGKGITALGGDSKLSRGIGAGVSTAVGTVGGNMVSKALGVGAGAINPYALGAQVLGNALGAGIGPSKEYGGTYGNITLNLDNAYDAATALVNVIPGWGQLASGMMTLNKGLSNVFGSTSGMTLQDSILGSAFMPAPVKWLNMAGANTTMGFGNLSWQNSEKANSFMLNAFGNLGDRFDQARREAGKTYGLFSRGAYNDALDNLAFANKAWNQVLDMANLNRIQNIRSSDMTSINNLRYALNIQGGWNPIYRGKQGMKILNGDFNHNIGMRLLSAAALINNKAMILSALTGTKFKVTELSDNTRVQRPIVMLPIERKLKPGQLFFNNHGQIVVVEPRLEYIQLDNRDSKVREESHKRSVQVRKQELMEKAEEQTALAAGAVLERTMPSYWVEKATGENLGTVGRLGVDLMSPYVLGKGFLLLGKAGLLVKVPKMAYSVEVKSPYYKIGQDGNLTFDTQNVVSEIKAGKLDFIDEMLSPEYAEAAIKNMEESEKMGLSYTPVFEKAGFKSLREDGIIPKFIQDPKHTWHARTGFMGGTPGKATEIEYNISQPTNIRYSTSHESGHVSRWGMGESKSELEYMKYKASQIFKDNGDVGVYEFGSLTGEGATNMRDLGKDMGITLRTPYPGYEKALEMLQNAEKTSNKGGIVKVLKLTKDAMPYIWRALQGLHFEYTIPTTLTATTLYNKSK